MMYGTASDYINGHGSGLRDNTVPGPILQPIVQVASPPSPTTALTAIDPGPLLVKAQQATLTPGDFQFSINGNPAPVDRVIYGPAQFPGVLSLQGLPPFPPGTIITSIAISSAGAPYGFTWNGNGHWEAVDPNSFSFYQTYYDSGAPVTPTAPAAAPTAPASNVPPAINPTTIAPAAPSPTDTSSLAPATPTPGISGGLLAALAAGALLLFRKSS